MIRAAHKWGAGNFSKSKSQGFPAPLIELFGGDVSLDAEVVCAGLQVLADGDDGTARCSQIGERLANFIWFFANGFSRLALLTLGR